MSLVAYGDSDDGSSDSDGEENTNLPSKISSLPSASSSIIQPSSSTIEHERETVPFASATSEEVSVSNSGKRLNLSSFLPKPHNPDNTASIEKSSFSTIVSNLNDDEDEIIEIEEEYIPLSQIKKDKKVPENEKNEEQKSVGSLFSRMPSPWSLGAGISLGKKKEMILDSEGLDKNKKGKQPVRIVAPTISEADFDDDDDDKEPAAKRAKKSKSGSGLSSLLPKPKHSITTTSYNPNKPSAKLSNRPLIPHTLTKKPAQSKDIKKAKTTEGNGSGDEDDDVEPVSFFSFDDKNKSESNVTKSFENIEAKTSANVNVLEMTVPIGVQSSYKKSETVTSIPQVTSTDNITAMNHGTLGVDNGRAVISYREEEEGSSRGDNGKMSSTCQYYDNDEVTTTTYYQPTTDISQQYAYGTYSENPQTVYYGGVETQGTYYQTYSSYVNTQDEMQSEKTEDLDIEKLKKLQGRRNCNEQINIIDINAADQTGDTQLQLTKITSEQVAHRPSKKKGNMPSSQQRRKHQITYLAFQAKEREFELQQQWSTNRQSKKQTQAKYGF